MEEVQSYRNRIAQLEDDLLFRLSNSRVSDPNAHCDSCIHDALAWLLKASLRSFTDLG